VIRDDLVAGPVPRNNVIDVIVDRHVLVAQPGKVHWSSLVGPPEAHRERIGPFVIGDGGEPVELRDWRAHEAGHDLEGRTLRWQLLDDEGGKDARLVFFGSQGVVMEQGLLIDDDREGPPGNEIAGVGIGKTESLCSGE
jgi:hypothetical protein